MSDAGAVMTADGEQKHRQDIVPQQQSLTQPHQAQQQQEQQQPHSAHKPGRVRVTKGRRPRADSNCPDLPPGIQDFVYKTCTTYMPGWKSLKPDNLAIKELNGGLTNVLYLLEAYFPSPALEDGVEEDELDIIGTVKPQRAVMRFFGKDVSLFFDRSLEIRISQEISRRGHGAKIYHTFEEFGGGRLEGFLEGHTLETPDLSRPALSLQIAEKVGKLHQMDLLNNQDEPSLFASMARWYKEMTERVKNKVVSVPDSDVSFSFDDLGREVKFLCDKLRSLNPVSVFCHNDLQEGNMIYNKDTDQLFIIDYEYASWNCREFDLANHFCEMYINYHNPNPPYFTMDPKQYPTKEHQQAFLKQYLQSFMPEEEQEHVDMDRAVAKLQHVVEWFILASHLQWALWSVLQSAISQIRFGYIEYAHARIVEYHRLKRLRIQEDEANDNTHTTDAHKASSSKGTAKPQENKQSS